MQLMAGHTSQWAAMGAKGPEQGSKMAEKEIEVHITR
jgi:hypothetical protein